MTHTPGICSDDPIVDWPGELAMAQQFLIDMRKQKDRLLETNAALLEALEDVAHCANFIAEDELAEIPHGIMKKVCAAIAQAKGEKE